MPQQQGLDQHAEEGDDECGGDYPTPESKHAADMRREGIRDVGPQHVQGPMCDVDDTRDAENQRKAGRDKEQTRGGGEPVERLKQERAESHKKSPLPTRRGEVTEGRDERKPSSTRQAAVSSPRRRLGAQM